MQNKSTSYNIMNEGEEKVIMERCIYLYTYIYMYV